MLTWLVFLAPSAGPSLGALFLVVGVVGVCVGRYSPSSKQGRPGGVCASSDTSATSSAPGDRKAVKRIRKNENNSAMQTPQEVPHEKTIRVEFQDSQVSRTNSNLSEAYNKKYYEKKAKDAKVTDDKTQEGSQTDDDKKKEKEKGRKKMSRRSDKKINSPEPIRGREKNSKTSRGLGHSLKATQRSMEDAGSHAKDGKDKDKEKPSSSF